MAASGGTAQRVAATVGAVALGLVATAYLLLPFTPDEFDRRCRSAVVDAWWEPPFGWSSLGNPLADRIEEARADGQSISIGTSDPDTMHHSLCSSPARTRVLGAAAAVVAALVAWRLRVSGA